MSEGKAGNHILVGGETGRQRPISCKSAMMSVINRVTTQEEMDMINSKSNPFMAAM